LEVNADFDDEDDVRTIAGATGAIVLVLVGAVIVAVVAACL